MKYWIFVGLSLIICKVFAQQSVYNNNDLGKRLLILEQKYFESKIDSEKYFYCLKKLEILLKNYRYEDANRELIRIEKFDSLIQKRNNYFEDISILCFKNNWFEGCLQILTSDTLSKQLFFIKTLCLNELENYTALKEQLKYFSFLNKLDTNQLFKDLKNYEISFDVSYQIMQAILPGSGMITLGFAKKGIVSFLLNGTFATIATKLIIDKFYIAGLVFGIFPFSKFYVGGIKHVAYLSSQMREKRLKKIKQHNAVLLYNYFK